MALYLDFKNTPIAWRTVSIGTDVMTPVKPWLVLQPAVLLGANALTFAHNRPSGDLEPSPEGLHLSETLCTARKLLGLRLLDNVIWTETGNRRHSETQPVARAEPASVHADDVEETAEAERVVGIARDPN